MRPPPPTASYVLRAARRSSSATTPTTTAARCVNRCVVSRSRGLRGGVLPNPAGRGGHGGATTTTPPPLGRCRISCSVLLPPLPTPLRTSFPDGVEPSDQRSHQGCGGRRGCRTRGGRQRSGMVECGAAGVGCMPCRGHGHHGQGSAFNSFAISFALCAFKRFSEFNKCPLDYTKLPPPQPLPTLPSCLGAS